MPSEAMNKWFSSKKPAQIESLKLFLRESPILKGKPLSVQQGQAEVFFARSKNGSKVILKIFHEGKSPNAAYLNKTATILPSHPALRCGKEREILTATSLRKNQGVYYSKDLGNYLEGGIVMPFIPGLDWMSVIDQIRNGRRVLSRENRLKLCISLAQTIKLLEEHQISHRDLSGGNVFIDPSTFNVSLIDFDSLYHPNLMMPKISAIGTEGYIAPFVDSKKTALTHSHIADRFALMVLCVEFLILDSSSPFSHEGGIFKQEEIYRRSGKTIFYAQEKLKKHYPAMLKLFMQALNSRSFNQCPAPHDWLLNKPSAASEFSIEMLPEVSIQTPKPRTILLPDDPWQSKGELNHVALAQSISQPCQSNHCFNKPLSCDSTLEVYLRSLELPMAKATSRNNRACLGKVFKGFTKFGLEGLLGKF